MGGGASSLNRLRKTLLLRAYNLRAEDMTLEEQFSPYAYAVGDQVRISIKDIKRILQLEDSSWAASLFALVCPSPNTSAADTLLFEDFLDFLETGRLPPPPTAKSSSLPPERKLHSSSSFAPPPIDTTTTNMKRSVSASPSGGQRRSWRAPPKPSSSGSNSRKVSLVHVPVFKPNVSCMYNEVILSLGLKIIPAPSYPLTTYQHRTISLPPKDTYRNPNGASKPLWRKVETVKQERTILYTTIDDAGLQQELVEKEIQISEVLHMECRQTGEFAHRETTTYEHIETFNNEVVGDVRGVEEYVHLKSKDDEFEYLDSNMPKKAPEEPEPEPIDPASASPNPQDYNNYDYPDYGSVAGSPKFYQGDEPYNPPDLGIDIPDVIPDPGSYTPMNDDISPDRSPSPVHRPVGAGSKGHLWDGEKGSDWGSEVD